jgi:hypothetical protein
MSLKNFSSRFVFILNIGQGTCIPDIRFFVFTPADNVSSVVAEAGADLTAGILVAPEFHLQ